MRFKDNGLANLHDRKRKERGFCCMQLIYSLRAMVGRAGMNGTGRIPTQPEANANTGHDARFTGAVKTRQNRTNKYCNE
ncbi:hypothetical protein [Bacteroides thetaiotaomicron]|uniref:hypothetical protein n=1 Tax=Bacteroides thetaiotaomicron TaxID=818 RepID=UPI001F1FE68C|nr:hypothetical protein [Bacteroides thetaiotaomicron]